MSVETINTPFSTVGYLTYKRTYARRLNEQDVNSPTEEFPDTIDRVIRASNEQLGVGFTEAEQERLRTYMLELKGSVAGRFLWQMGTETVDRLGLASLQNCAFVTIDEPVRPFTWAMDMLMLGSGVGYNLQKVNIDKLPVVNVEFKTPVRIDEAGADYIVPDTREGWVSLLAKTLKAAFLSDKESPVFSYSTQLIRGKGAPIKSFGGTASGPEDLCWGIKKISEILMKRVGKKIRPIDALDLMNIIGAVVVAGNVRRSAQIAIGDSDDVEFLLAKRWDIGSIPSWRSMSNNSVVCSNINDLHDYFWDGYEGKGEPYGLINLKLSRKIGRLGETEYPDPGVQGYNPCFRGDMQLLTSDGYQRLDGLVGKTFFNINKDGETTQGKVWSNGVKDIVEVRPAKRESIFCTPDHIFMLNTGDECMAKDLAGKRLMPFYKIKEFPTESLTDFKAGFILGDGVLNRRNSGNHRGMEVCIGKKDLEVGRLFGVSIPGNHYLTEVMDIANKYNLLGTQTYNRELPDTVTDDFMMGLYSANGSVISTGKRVALKATSYKLVEQVVQILKALGMTPYVTTNKAKIMKFSNGEYICKQSYDVNLIGLDNLKKFAEKISFLHEYKRASLETAIKDSGPSVRMVRGAGTSEVFDFTEPKTHWGVVSDVVVHNCAEQGLESHETCCLAEVFLPNITSQEELNDVVQLLYRVCKHSLLLPCHSKETEAIVHKNMRMGIGMTGVLQASEEQRSWLKDAYVELRKFDVEYSEERGINTSVKLTTIKPSGTLSLLPGVTSGIHPAYSQYMIRRIRIMADHPLVDVCREHGYPIEYQQNFDGSEDHSTVVVSFPFSYPEGTVMASDMSALDQLAAVKQMQEVWSDNSVSCTVYYKKEELPEIKKYLAKNYKGSHKSLSFLLHNEHGFKQAPFESVSKGAYEDLLAAVKLITSIGSAEFEGGEECAGGMCPIK